MCGKMKTSLKLQKKREDLAEKAKLKAKISYLNMLEERLSISAGFLPPNQGLLVNANPWQYINAKENLNNPLETLPIENTDKPLLLQHVLRHLDIKNIKGDMLFYHNCGLYNGYWLQVPIAQMDEFLCYIFNDESHRYVFKDEPHMNQFDCLISSVSSNKVMAVFQEEWDYLICSLSE